MRQYLTHDQVNEQRVAAGLEPLPAPRGVIGSAPGVDTLARIFTEEEKRLLEELT